MDIYGLGKILADLWYGTDYRAMLVPAASTKRDGSPKPVAVVFSQSPDVDESRGTAADFPRSAPANPPIRLVDLIRHCVEPSHRARPDIRTVEMEISTISQDLAVPGTLV